MKEEKVMHIKLPDGAKYRRVEVTEDGGIDIVYTKQNEDSKKTIKKIDASIPKPKPLVGSTEVYQKDNGMPYWYCKIKEGRDEFMHVYFDDLTYDDLSFHTKVKFGEYENKEEKAFRENVLKALRNKPKEGYRWIPVFEPSKDSKGNLQYVAGEDVLREVNLHEWEKMFEEYSPQNGSQQASITTYFLLALRWLKDGVATFNQLVYNSCEIGHSAGSKNAKEDFEKTGEREFGGLFGFVGNTFKIVKDSNSSSGFSSVGGYFCKYGYVHPFANVNNLEKTYDDYYCAYGVGLLELTK